MRKNFEVTYDELLSDKRKNILSFKTTEDIEISDRLIGQERAEKAMEFGINMKQKGYNIYISGKSGSGRTSYAMSVLKRVSKSSKTPDDWCYVYNFDNEYQPMALNFQWGMGKVFKHDMEYIVNEVVEEIPAAFTSQEYDRQKNEILEEYHHIKNMLVEELNNTAALYNLQVKETSAGFVFIPIIDEKPMSEGEYDKLEKANKEQILKNIGEMRIKTIEILRKLKLAEKENQEKIKKLNGEIGYYVIETIMSNFTCKYMKNEEVLKYLELVKKDMVKNLPVFIEGIDMHSLSKEEDEFLSRYRVNLLIDNSEINGAPVVYESNPTFTNLIGNVEYESKQGNITTDFLMIRAGSILKANGGYLVVPIKDILKNYQAWEGLKRVINTNEIKIESIRSQLDLLTIAAIKPEPIPVNFKVILVGTEYIYQLLWEYDEEFCDLFKIKVDFDTDMERNDENINKFARFIGFYCRKNGLRHLSSDAVMALTEYSSSIADSKKKLTTCLEKITEIINEANMWAEVSKNKYIENDHIKKAILEKKKRINLVEEKMINMYRDKKILIKVRGEEVGQINGLSVVEVGGYCFGKPCRITASTYMGKNGIVNIEREVDMSGNIHNKSVMIISGYLGEKYAKNLPLSLTATICFEQLYGYVDGDSASIAELYAILSSLAEIPIKQSIAVTGSLNQKGEVQPVGGINEKIEGFYRICLMNGLDKSHGIIIPYQNIDDLILNDDILRDIKNGLFHIYAIKNVEDGIEILTGMKPGNANSNGEFEEDTFNYFVSEKLKCFIKNYNALDELKHQENAKSKITRKRL